MYIWCLAPTMCSVNTCWMKLQSTKKWVKTYTHSNTVWYMLYMYIHIHTCIYAYI
jgi:hypothetical protein